MPTHARCGSGRRRPLCLARLGGPYSAGTRHAMGLVAGDDRDRLGTSRMAGHDDNSQSREDGSRSFWVTAPGLITAIGGLLTAIAVLIGALSAAGVIGGDDASSSPSTIPSSGPQEPSLNEAVLNGDWLVDVEILRIDGPGAMGDNKLWNLEPTEGVSRQEHWTLESSCPESPCETRWDSVETPNRFAILGFDNGTYVGTDTGSASCQGGSVPVDRGMMLNITDAADIGGVWSATAISGHIETSWTCEGKQVGGVLGVDGTRSLP